jgi:NADPH:quinone reductase-like Zn-dependent oxidoreductase
MLSEFGPPSVLVPAELPDPVPGPQQCAVLAAGAPGITRLSFGPITPGQSAELTRRALDLAVSGTLRSLIGQRFPLDRAADAHAAIEARATIGKTLLIANPR